MILELKHLKKILIINCIGVVVFSVSILLGKVNNYDFRYLGIIFTACAWAYSIGIFVLDKREKKTSKFPERNEE